MSESRSEQRFPCRCENIAGSALCFGCLHERNLEREQNAAWKKRYSDNGNGGAGQ